MPKKDNHSPPKWILTFFRWYCRPDYLEDIEGDLRERMARRSEQQGIRYARRHFTLEVLRLFRPGLIRSFPARINIFNRAMFKNHFKIAWRNIKKDKLFTTIKIGGFGVGIAACLLIALFIRDELSYDHHYAKKDRIFRVIMESTVDGNLEHDVYYSAPFAKALQADIPEIEKAGRFLDNPLFGSGNKELRRHDQTQNNFEEGFVFADQELLEILEIPLAEGNEQNALADPGTIVISQAKADKYFPKGDAMGKTLILDNNISKPYKITGVMADSNTRSHFNYDFLMTMEGRNFYEGEDDNWRAQNYPTYVLINDKANVQELEKKMYSIVEDYILPIFEEGGNLRLMDIVKTVNFKLQPIGDIHLKSGSIDDDMHHGDIRFVWLFGLIAIFILLLACINFINLSTAKSANKAREVGLRKTVGAGKNSLVVQFLAESFVFSAISFALGVILAWTLLPYFNTMASKDLVLPWAELWFLPVIAASSILVGIVAGLYPAFFLSSFRPVDVLKGSRAPGSKSQNLRSGLVVFQFTVSIVLIIGTMIIYQQTNFILNKKLGYDKDQVVVVQGTNILGDKIKTFKERLLQLSEIQQVTLSDFLPIEGTMRNQNPFWKKGKRQEDQAVGGQIWNVDEDYITTLGLKLIQGRNFSNEMVTDSAEAVIINEAMAREFGFDNAVGQELTNGRIKKVIGVVEDFHFSTLRQDIQPLMLKIGDSRGMVSVRLAPTNAKEVLKTIETIWQEFVPNQSFRYSFLSQDFAKMHEDVNRMNKIFNSFALFAVLVACLGLFALSAFMAEQRRKEISIRMVLGASFKNIYELLSLHFLKLVGISFLVAIPISWYIMNRWLEDFAYRIHLGWGVFMTAGIIALIIAFLTISYQSVGAALINPVKSLRTE